MPPPTARRPLSVPRPRPGLLLRSGVRLRRGGYAARAAAGAQRAPGHDRHAAGRPAGLLRRPGAVTPNLDGLAARGALSRSAVAHAPLTAPSHASILTGLTPRSPRRARQRGLRPARGRATLAEAFRQAGYRTAAFVSGFPLERRFGFARGFDTYDDRLPRGKDARRTAYVERPADRTTDAALRWLETATPPASARTPFFLWVHYFDPHAPYEAPAGRWPAPPAPYDGEVAFVDAQLGRLLRGLDEAAGGPTLVLVTADHGESLGEHGEDTHGIFVYDSTLRVPLILAGPGVPAGGVPADRGARHRRRADAARLRRPRREGRCEGRSLRRAAREGLWPTSPPTSESLHSQLQYGWAPLHAWRTAKHKLIEAPRVELYDLAADPGEAHDLSAREASRVEGMRRELQRAMTTTDAERGAGGGPGDGGAARRSRLCRHGREPGARRPRVATPRTGSRSSPASGATA